MAIELCRVSRITSHACDCGRPSVIEGIRELRCPRLSRGIAFIGRCCAVGQRVGLQSLSVAVDPRDRVLVHRAAVGRLIGHVTRDVSNRGTPASEAVSILCVRFLARISGLHDVSRCRAIVVRSCFLQNSAIFVNECDVVLVHSTAVGRSIGCIGRDIRNRGTPADEGVGVLGVRFLARIGGLHDVSRCRAIVVRSCFLQNRAVFVNERDVVLVHSTAVGRSVGRVSRDVRNRGAPAGEGVGILGVRFLARIGGLHDVIRCRTIIVSSRFLQDRTVFVLEGHIILPLRFGIGCSIGCVSRDVRNRGTPASEGVGVLSIRCLCRIGGLHDVIRRCAVVIRGRSLQLRSIFIHEGNIILPLR